MWFSYISPITDLYKKHQPNNVIWSGVCNKDFDKVKALLSAKPVLARLVVWWQRGGHGKETAMWPGWMDVWFFLKIETKRSAEHLSGL